MLYGILAYHVEDVVVSWTADEDTAVMANLHELHEKLTADGRMGPAARLGGTKGAFTLRGPGAGVIIDGPFAETKEQLLGFYVVDCATREDAIATARDLRRVNPTAVYEIRPVQLFLPGSPMAATHALTDHVRPASS
ncbi:YciI family protein [Tardiphaga sp. 862_B3_N1_1]|uniref:YciI family protein n=1 Tax=Tardiphaga sp. 862_B3_N1_1 TaxID=3240763 RepID=UPI003F8BB846